MMRKKKKEIQFEQPSDLLLVANKYMVLFVAVIVFTVLILGYFFFLKPKIDQINSVQVETTETQERKVKNEALLTKLKELEAEYNDIKENRKADLEKLKTVVPYGTQIPELFVLADTLADDYNFNLLSINVSESSPDRVSQQEELYLPPEVAGETNTSTPAVEEVTIDDLLTESGIKAMVVHLNISRSVSEDASAEDASGQKLYQDFKDYLVSLERSMRLLDIHAINFGEIPGDLSGSSHNFSIDLITYYQ